MRLIKSALCILVIFALAVSLVPTTASASALTVVGTSFSSAGMTSAEFAASAGPYAIGILGALAAAYGIKAFTQTESGQAVKEFFQGLIEKRAAATRRSVAEQMEALLGNATIDEDGNIKLGRLSFAEAKETLFTSDIAVTRPSETLQLGNYVFANSRNYVYSSDDDPDGYIYYLGADTAYENNMFFQTAIHGGYLCFVSVSGISNNINGYITSKNLETGHLGEYYPSNWYRVHNINIGNRIMTIRMFGYRGSRYNRYAPVYNINDILNQEYTGDDLIINSPTDTLYGVDETLRDQNVGLNEGLVLAPDLINGAVLAGASGQISASDYCGALVDYVSGYDTVIDGVTVTGLPEAGTVPRSVDEAPTSDMVIDEAPPSTMTGTEAAGLYSFSLDELFPFCLPFDFVKIIEKFNVEPQAPNFDWRFYIPGVIDYTLHIDLSAWNTAAEVCRTMVLIAFMVGLIMLTRQIFIRA